MADDELSSTDTSVRYHRRLDRTPEKNFDKHEENVKILACLARGSVEKINMKMTKLRDELDNRDKTIDEERKLRKEAEERLHAYLVDPYSNSDVNDELRERLPRANKADPLRSTSPEVPESKDPFESSRGSNQEFEEIMEKEQVHNTATARLPEVIESESALKQRNTKADAGGAIYQGQGPLSTVPNISQYQAGIPSLQNTSLNGTLYRPQAPMYLPQSYAGPYISSFAPSQYLQQPPSSFLSPPRTFAMTSALHSPYTPSSQPNREVPQQSPPETDESMDSPLKVNDLSSSPSKFLGDVDNGGNMNRESVPISGEEPSLMNREPHLTNSTSTRTFPFQPHKSSGIGVVPPNLAAGGAYFQDPFQLRYSSGYFTPLEGSSRQMAMLMAEIETLKAQNKKLVSRVADLELEVETGHIIMKTKELDKHTESDAAQAASLVQEVHAAQKKRDDSVMGRIKLANQERDEALFHLREVERRLEDQGYGTPDKSPDRSDVDEFDDEEDDENVQRIMSRLGQIDMAGNMDRECSTLVRKLEQMKQRQQEITSEEMQILLQQRDSALAKAKRLEEDLLRHRHQESFASEQNLKAKLLTAQRERDMAMSKLKHLQEEINTLKLYYSLHKSLMPKTLDSNMNDSQADERSQKESNTTMAQLRSMEHDKMQAEANLQKMEHELHESQDKITKLEKLVDVLRRKLRPGGQKGED